MKDNVIYVRDTAKRYNARDVISVISDSLDGADSVTLNELCQLLEQWADSVSFDDEGDDDGIR